MREIKLEDFPTLRDYDEAAYFLRQWQPALDYPPSKGKPYRGSFFLDDTTVFLDGQYRTVSLSMAASYIYAQLCNGASEQLKKRIPYHYVPGRYHGRIEGRYRRWDMRVAANGRESLVEELQRRIWNYEEKRLDILLTRWDAARRSCAYFVETKNSSNQKLHVILSDKSALGRVRARYLLEDCRSIQQPLDTLAKHVDREKALLAAFIDEQHAVVLWTYGSNVVRMPERYRIPIR